MDDGKSLEVGEEIIEEEILTRVSVRAALRLRCVSKSWRSLIDSGRFIKKHLQNSSTLQRVIINYCFCFEERLSFVRCSRFYLGDDKPSYCPINDPPETGEYPYNVHPLQTGILLGHCNGLLCIYEPFDTACFFLWNPATRVSVKLPKIDHNQLKDAVKYGFGWDQHTAAYKVFVSDDETAAKVYSSNTNSWTTVDRGCHSLINGFGVFAYGKIHWITASGHIESFDLKGDVFETTMRLINQPCKPREGLCVWLWEWRDRLYIVCHIAKERRDSDIAKDERRVWLINENENEKENEEFRWIEDKQVNSQLDARICGSYGAFSYMETLVSPPFLALEDNTTTN